MFFPIFGFIASVTVATPLGDPDPVVAVVAPYAVAPEVTVVDGFAADDLLLLPHAASASTPSAATASRRTNDVRMEPPGLTSVRRTGAGPIGFNEPREPAGRIVGVMVDARPVLTNDDGVRAVYAAHGPELYRFALRSLGDRGLAEDAVQETFVRAWQAAGTFDVEREPAAWLATIAKRAAIDIYRREARRPASDIVDLAADDPAVVTLPPDLGTVDAVWQVRNAIEQLSPDEADIIRMHHLEGMTHVQISEQLGVALGTVKSRSHRAHARLATLLGHLKETVA
jgi:RNA polymerase sigma-70 factor (ECF subfamily)